MRRAFLAAAIDPLSSNGFLNELNAQNANELKTLISELLNSERYSTADKYQLLTNDKHAGDALALPLRKLALDLLKDGHLRPEVLEQAIINAVSLARVPDVLPFAKARCPVKNDQMQRCVLWFSKMAGYPVARYHLILLTDEQMASIETKRRFDMGNLDLIEEYAQLIEQRDSLETAERVLSEMVEFARTTTRRDGVMRSHSLGVSESQACGQPQHRATQSLKTGHLQRDDGSAQTASGVTRDAA